MTPIYDDYELCTDDPTYPTTVFHIDGDIVMMLRTEKSMNKSVGFLEIDIEQRP